MIPEVARSPRSAILLIHCPDRKGLVAAVTDFLCRHDGNIIELEQHVDLPHQAFFMRVEWDLAAFRIPSSEIGREFERTIAGPFNMQWKLHFSDDAPRLAILVSKLPHCLCDILARCESGEWQASAPLIISNHADMEPIARRSGAAFHVEPITAGNKPAQEQKILALLREHRIDLIVLARYMQVLSGEFVDHYPQQIINIHHSFLPAFPGAKPYHSAHERGVKIVGATSHYVTSELDGGPIIEQEVAHVTHKDTVEDLVRKGRDLEKIVLARAVWHHLRRKILVHANRTIVFT